MVCFFSFPSHFQYILVRKTIIISCILYIYYLFFLPVGFTLDIRFLKVLVCYELPLWDTLPYQGPFEMDHISHYILC